MCAKVLLVSFNRYKTPAPVYPLGLTYIADATIAAGHEVRFVDLNTASDDWNTTLDDFHPDVAGISVRNVDEVVINHKKTLLGDLDKVVACCRKLKPKAVIIGGAAVSLFPVEILKLSGADYALCGEGEHSFVELVDSIASGIAPAHGVIPRHAFENVFCNQYDEAIRAEVAPYYIKQSGMLNIQTQRGCPLKCNYCTYPSIEGVRMRRKDIPSVIAELKLMQRLGTRYFFVTDGVFNSSRTYVAELCREMIKNGITMKWCCFLRPSDIDDELAVLMAKAGLAHVELGTDSLSETMIRSFGKNFTFADVLKSSSALSQASVKVCHFIIFGGIGETEATVSETFERSRELKGDIFTAGIGLRVYPGTRLHAELTKSGHEFGRIDLLNPAFYLSPSFTENTLDSLIRKLGHMRSEWIIPPIPTQLENDIVRMRKKGILGPLWYYMELMQRFHNGSAS